MTAAIVDRRSFVGAAVTAAAAVCLTGMIEADYDSIFFYLYCQIKVPEGPGTMRTFVGHRVPPETSLFPPPIQLPSTATRSE